MAKERLLILSVDRDDDLGRKTGIAGPVIGKAKVVEAATSLSLADPEEADANAMFQAAKLYGEMKVKYTVEVAVLTGTDNVGIESDREVAKQFYSVLGKFKADYAILVTDGSEDEHVLPIIQSKVPILSVSRVIVKQADRLESTYYTIKDFLKESMEDAKFAGLVYGIPAVILLLFGIFGAEGLRWVIGLFGVYLFLKATKIEDGIFDSIREVRKALETKRSAFFMYLISMLLLILATYQGYNGFLEWLRAGIFESVSGFVLDSIYVYYGAVAFAWIGRNIMAQKRRKKRVLSVLVFGLGAAILIRSTAYYILVPGVEGSATFLYALITGFILLGASAILEQAQKPRRQKRVSVVVK